MARSSGGVGSSVGGAAGDSGGGGGNYGGRVGGLLSGSVSGVGLSGRNESRQASYGSFTNAQLARAQQFAAENGIVGTRNINGALVGINARGEAQMQTASAFGSSNAAAMQAAVNGQRASATNGGNTGGGFGGGGTNAGNGGGNQGNGAAANLDTSDANLNRLQQIVNQNAALANSSQSGNRIRAARDAYNSAQQQLQQINQARQLQQQQQVQQQQQAAPAPQQQAQQQMQQQQQQQLQQQQQQAQQAAQQAEQARQEAARQEAARQEAARQEAARQAELARQKEERRVAQVGERDKAIAQLTPGAELGSRIWGSLKGAYDSINSVLEGPKTGTVGGTLFQGAKWGMRGMEALGPAGGILGALGGMIYGSGVLDKATLEDLKGYNPNGEQGVTLAGDLAKREGPFWGDRTGHAGDRDISGGNRTATPSNGAPDAPTPVDKQAQAAINQLIPQSARNMIEAGEQASNSYLRALHGRYAKYLLGTGATGSGTNLLARTAGGQQALGGVSGRLLYSTGGNNG